MIILKTLLVRFARVMREILLTVAAIAGVVCIALTLIAFVGGFSLIMFKTGSMSPTIPAGSVALVQRVLAAELVVGDVVTINRVDALPITHRITGISPGPTAPERIITMRGDANESEDPLPYTITDARIVRGSVPHLASFIVALGSPWVLGTLTVAATLLVTWAFWPRRTRHHVQPPAARPSAVVVPDEDRMPQTRRERRAREAVMMLALFLVPLPVLFPAHPAAASDIVSILSSLDHTNSHHLDAHTPLLWGLVIDAHTALGDGALTVALNGRGDPSITVTAEIRGCSAAWSTATCPAREELLRPARILPLTGSDELIMRVPTPASMHLRVALTAEVTDAPAATATITVRATAAQDSAEEQIGGGSHVLAATGTNWPGYLMAPAAVGAGLGIALLARMPRGER